MNVVEARSDPSVRSLGGAKRDLWFYLGLALITCGLIYYHGKGLEVQEGWVGYGLASILNNVLHPDLMAGDWQWGWEGPARSLSMKFMIFISQQGVEPLTLILLFMAGQKILLTLSMAYFALGITSERVPAFLWVLLASSSTLVGINLGQWGAGLGWFPPSLYYDTANALTLLALGAFFRSRHLACFVYLSLGVFAHPTISILTGACISGYYIIAWRQLSPKRALLVGWLIFVSASLLFVFLSRSDQLVGSNAASQEEWLKTMLLFSIDWFPWHQGVFHRYAYLIPLPIALLCFFAFLATRYGEITRQANIKTLAISIGALALTVFGLVGMEVFMQTFIIKLSAHRINYLITIIGSYYLVYYLYRHIKEGRPWLTLAGIYALACMFFVRPGLAIFPLLLLLANDLSLGRFGLFAWEPGDQDGRAARLARFAAKSLPWLAPVMLIPALLSAALFTEGQRPPFARVLEVIHRLRLDPLGVNSFDYWFRGGYIPDGAFLMYCLPAAAILCGLAYLARSRGWRLQDAGQAVALALGCAGLFVALSNDLARWSGDPKKVAFVQAQYWIRENTPPASLIMTDPGESGGMRTWARRGLFGTMREWGYYPFAYVMDQERFRKGKERLALFGLDLDKHTLKSVQKEKTYYLQYVDEASKRYYRMSPEGRRAMMDRYGISYFVMENKRGKAPAFPVAYTNNFYTIYRNDSPNRP